MFALWTGRKWNIQQRTAGLVTRKDAKEWIDERLPEHERKGTKVMLAGKTGFASFVTSYKSYLKMKGLSTFDEESGKLGVMVEFFGDEPLENIDYERVMEFKSWLIETPYTRTRRLGQEVKTVSFDRKPSSVHRYLSRLRHLLKYAAKASKIRSVPAFDDAIVPSDERPKEVNITFAEFMKVLNACDVVPKGATTNRRRWCLPLIAAYTSGCRVGELWDIWRRDITSLDSVNRTGVIKVTKNKIVRGKMKQITKKVTITTWLYDEMEAAGALDKADDERLFMWTKEYRGPIVNDKYSLFNLAGVSPEATFHTLRAASATNRDAAGQDFDSLQNEIGHAKGSLVTRKHYIRPDDQQVINASYASATYNEYLERMRSEENLASAHAA